MKSLSYRLAPVLVVLVVVLVALAAAGNWYLRPERAAAWATGMLTLPVLWIAATLVLRRQLRRTTSEAARERAVYAIRQGLAFAGLILLASLSGMLATALGLSTDSALPERASMVVVGLVLMCMGNALPKALTPLSVMQCDGARAQAFQRFMGWTWVLMGLGYATSWLVLPVDLAKPVSIGCMGIGMLLFVAQIVRLASTRRRTFPPAEV